MIAARKQQRGFSQLELAVSTLLVGLLMITALTAVASSRRSQIQESDTARATLLAEALMAEILQQPYTAGGPIGRESGENTRAQFNDIDDYYDLVESPPMYRSGGAIPGYTGWTQAAQVVYVDDLSLTTLRSADEGILRITVTVSKANKTLATLVAYRTRDWPQSNL